jgi:O-antigen/teichoic acid export membrane protein
LESHHRLDPTPSVIDVAGPAPSGTPVPSPPGTDPTSTALLDRTLVHGLAWTGSVKWGSQLIAWFATLFVARTLMPADYGIFAMSAVYMGLITLLSEFGIGAAVVVLRDLSDELVAQTNTLSLMFGAAAFAVSCIVAVPLAWFFNTPALTAVVIVLSVAFLVTAFRTVPYSLLQKEMRFKLLAFIDGVQSLASSFSMVVLALLGFGYWTLVLGGLLGAIVSTVLVLAARRYRFAWPRGPSVRRVVTFGWHMVVTRLAFYVYSSADLFVAGKTLPKAALGSYSFAVSLATMLPEKVLALVASVTPAIFSSIQAQEANLRRYLLSITEGLALVVFPATLGLAAVAEPFVLVVLGEKWRPMIAPMQVLAAYAGFRSIAAQPGNLLNVIGEIRFSMRVQVAAAVTLPFAFYVGAHWGAVGIAAAWVVIHPLVNLPLYWRAFHRIGLSTRQYLETLAPALGSSAVMLVAIWAAHQAVPPDWPPTWILGLEIVTGAIAYGLALFMFGRSRIQLFYQKLKLLRS